MLVKCVTKVFLCTLSSLNKDLLGVFYESHFIDNETESQ